MIFLINFSRQYIYLRQEQKITFNMNIQKSTIITDRTYPPKRIKKIFLYNTRNVYKMEFIDQLWLLFIED